MYSLDKLALYLGRYNYIEQTEQTDSSNTKS